MTIFTPTKGELLDLLRRIRDDPDAGAWAEWARRLIEEEPRRKRTAAARPKAQPRTRRRR